MYDIQILIIGHLSFAAAAFSFLMKDIVSLRLIAIISSILGIVYNFFVADEPLWLVISWLGIFIIINSFQIIHVFLEPRMIKLSGKELNIRNNFFQELSLTQFNKIIKLSNTQTVAKNSYILKKNQPVLELRLILSGEVSIEEKGRAISSLKAGAFIGEVSFMSGSRATADVRTLEETSVISWNQSNLRRLLIANPSLHLLFNQIINSDLAKKLSFKA